MLLRDLLGEGPGDVQITSLAYDNRSVSPGTLFFCVPGFTRDGHDYAADAIARGAAALVVERPLGLGVPEVQVPSVRAAMAPAAAKLAGDPSAKLRMVGITGTNGKTTSAFLVRHLLEAGGIQTGMLGTVKAIVGGRSDGTIRTTPEAIDLQPLLAQMLEAGDRACAMEVSSHALELHRSDAIHWAVALFTNLTQDHLDFHTDMDAYFLAKRRLFEQAEGTRVANVDDPHGAQLAREFPGTTTIAIENAAADIRAANVTTSLRGATFTLHTPAGEREIELPLPGSFNVLNALGAVAAALALDVPFDVAAAALATAPPIPGRFEPVDEGQEFAVIVDYAHTPDSLENVLRAARGLAHRHVTVVFGAGGDRDRGKRPLMGAAASALADHVIVTSDNPRSEDPEAIIADIQAGTDAAAEAIVDRRAAIALAIERARPGDVVVIAGKGHEQGQEFAGGRKEPFDDVAVARATLGEVGARR